jgi:hypothetical protein
MSEQKQYAIMSFPCFSAGALGAFAACAHFGIMEGFVGFLKSLAVTALAACITGYIGGRIFKKEL